MSGERETYPSERALAEAREEQSALRTHVAYPGRVQSYYADSQTADIVPLIRQQVPQPDGSYALEELPVLPSVPVVWPRVGAWFLAMALVPGDTVQLLCNTSAIGHWRTGTGDVTDPGDLRRQHLAHAVALPGLYTRGKALAHAPSGDTGLVLGSDAADGPRVTLRADGSIVIQAATGARVDMQGASQAFVRGDTYADALGDFLAAQATFATGVGTVVAGIGAYCATAAVTLPLLAPAAATLAPIVAAFVPVVTNFGSAVASFAAARARYLSTRIRGE